MTMTEHVANEEVTQVAPEQGLIPSSVSIQAMSVALPARFLVEGRTVPIAIDKAQEYYWTKEWQEGVREAIAALGAGEFVRFDSDDPTDVARWLLDTEE